MNANIVIESSLAGGTVIRPLADQDLGLASHPTKGAPSMGHDSETLGSGSRKVKTTFGSQCGFA